MKKKPVAIILNSTYSAYIERSLIDLKDYPVEKFQNTRARYNAITEHLEKLRREALEILIANMRDRDIGLNEIAQIPAQNGHVKPVDTGYFYKMLTATFALPIDSIPSIVRYATDETINELLFGERKTIRLGNEQRTFLSAFSSLPAKGKSEILDAMTANEFSYRAPSVVAYERLMQMVDDAGCTQKDIYPAPDYPAIRNCFARWLEYKNYCGQVTSLMYFSLIFDVPVDFWLCQDYSGEDIEYINSFGIVTKPTDEERKALSLYLMQSRENAIDIYGKTLAMSKII